MTNYIDQKDALSKAVFISPREIDATSGDVQDELKFQGFIVWSENATISFEADETLSNDKATDFSEKVVPGDGKMYPLTGKRMLVKTGGIVTLSLK